MGDTKMNKKLKIIMAEYNRLVRMYNVLACPKKNIPKLRKRDGFGQTI